MTTTLTITKGGRIDFERPIKASQISLKSITLYLNIYNIPKDSTYTNGSNVTPIPAGWYTHEQLKNLFNGDFTVNENTLEFKMGGDLSGSITKRVGDKFMYLTPLCLYLRVDEIDSFYNYFNGERSNLLSTIFIGNTEPGAIITYNPINETKKLYSSDTFSSLYVRLEDDLGYEYKGPFVANFFLNE